MYATGHLHWIFASVKQVSLPILTPGISSGTQEKVETQLAEQAEVKTAEEQEQKPEKKPKKAKVEKKGKDKKSDKEGT